MYKDESFQAKGFDSNYSTTTLFTTNVYAIHSTLTKCGTRQFLNTLLTHNTQVTAKTAVAYDCD